MIGIVHEAIDRVVRLPRSASSSITSARTKYLGHQLTTDKGESQAQEKGADAHAIDMIIGGIAPGDARFDARGLTIALAFALLSNGGIHTGSAGAKSHPRRFDRL